MAHRAWTVFGAVGVVAVLGCGGPAPLEGRVEFADGSPLTKGQLIFDSGSYSEFAPIDSQGHFKTFKGLPNGTYKVAIYGAVEGEYEKAVVLVDKRYTQMKTTDLEVTVDGAKKDVSLTVERPTAKRK